MGEGAAERNLLKRFPARLQDSPILLLVLSYGIFFLSNFKIRDRSRELGCTKMLWLRLERSAQSASHTGFQRGVIT